MCTEREAELITLAETLGATGAAIIDSSDIVIKESLARLCEEPRCPNYGLATSCPPHVSGPDGFRELVAQHPRALVVKIDVPADVLLMPDVADVMRLVHEVGTSVEQRALALGYARASSYAGGSCKKLLCFDEPDCAVVDRDQQCRHPEQARPSMSGYGVDTSTLLQTAGWTLHRVEPGAKPSQDDLGTLCGMVLLG